MAKGHKGTGVSRLDNVIEHLEYRDPLPDLADDDDDVLVLRDEEDSVERDVQDTFEDSVDDMVIDHDDESVDRRKK